jgi:GABA permease
VQNPLRSEADAFRFVGVVLVAAALIVGAARANTWFGLAAALVVIGGVTLWYWHQPSPAPPPVEVPHEEHAVHRVLVIANETVGGRALSQTLIERAGERAAELLVVAPALNSPLRYWTSDEDGARAAADERVRASVARLGDLGLTARGEVGAAEPLQAIEDSMRTFEPDEIVISTHPVGRSNWLERGLVDEARRRFDVPITHVIVDLEAEGA